MRFTTLGRLTSAIVLGGTMIGSSLVGSTVALAADSNDKMTGLPLHEGLSFQQEVDSPVCGKAASMNLYDTPVNASLDQYMAWYKQQLKNFHYVHQVWSDRPQEMFYSPDGSRGVSITGTPSGKGVFAVTYMKMSGNLTTHQEDVFSPSNSQCK